MNNINELHYVNYINYENTNVWYNNMPPIYPQINLVITIIYNRSMVIEEGIEFKAYIQVLSGRTFSVIMNTNYQCIILDFLDIFSNIEHSNRIITFTATHKMYDSMRNKIIVLKKNINFILIMKKI